MWHAAQGTPCCMSLWQVRSTSGMKAYAEVNLRCHCPLMWRTAQGTRCCMSLWQGRSTSGMKACAEVNLGCHCPDVACCAGDTLLHEAVNMSSRVGLVKPNDHIVVVQMISDSLVVKASLRCSTPLLCTALLEHSHIGPRHGSGYSFTEAIASSSARGVEAGSLSAAEATPCALNMFATRRQSALNTV